VLAVHKSACSAELLASENCRRVVVSEGRAMESCLLAKWVDLKEAVVVAAAVAELLQPVEGCLSYGLLSSYPCLFCTETLI